MVINRLPLIALCPAEAPVCSGCGSVLSSHRHRVRTKPGGAVLIHCGRRRGTNRNRTTCAQWNYVIGLYSELCAVVHLSPEQATIAKDRDVDPRTLLEELDMIVTAQQLRG